MRTFYTKLTQSDTEMREVPSKTALVNMAVHLTPSEVAKLRRITRQENTEMSNVEMLELVVKKGLK